MAVLPVFTWQGLSISTSGTIFSVTPTWQRKDNLAGARLSEVQIRRGRSDEMERTDTGSMTCLFHDRTGAVDPSLVDWISRPIAFAVRNPVTGNWRPRFRGGIDDHRYDLSPGRVKGDVVIEAVDALAYFAGFELAPGIAGNEIPAGSDAEGYVFYEDTEGGTGPQIRINKALTDSKWPTGLRSVFTGNVDLLETTYSPGESLLAVIHDAADAEFPGVANFFIDRHGVACFHGRFARFDPTEVAADASHWDFHDWDLGVGGVQIRWPFQLTRSARIIRNAAMCYPQSIRGATTVEVFPAADRVNQVVVNNTSANRHGWKSWSAENLQTAEGVTSGLTGPQECLTFANYIIQNYATSQVRLDQVTIRPVHPSDPRAADTWNLLCNVDISDRVILTMDHPGGGGLAMAAFFVEGISETWWPGEKDLATGWPMCEMTLDLSPATHWTTPPSSPAVELMAVNAVSLSE